MYQAHNVLLTPNRDKGACASVPADRRDRTGQEKMK